MTVGIILYMLLSAAYDMHYYKYVFCTHSWNSPLLYCDMLLHHWKPGNNTGSHRENVGCVGLVSLFS